ncbi:hypothetical protein HAX54_004376, partial [Datura stramonium]|nr:hypothetical protein [Datura stramonium]
VPVMPPKVGRDNSLKISHLPTHHDSDNKSLDETVNRGKLFLTAYVRKLPQHFEVPDDHESWSDGTTRGATR